MKAIVFKHYRLNVWELPLKLNFIEGENSQIALHMINVFP